MNKRRLGKAQEEMAAQFLKENGYEIIDKNFYCRSGEIDIIAKENGYLVFVEVKFRKDISCGYPQEAVTKHKIEHIINSARYYMLVKGYAENTLCRFDVIGILGRDISIIKNAF